MPVSARFEALILGVTVNAEAAPETILSVPSWRVEPIFPLKAGFVVPVVTVRFLLAAAGAGAVSMVPPNVSAAVPVVATAVSALRVRFPFRLTFAADVMVPPREEVPVTVNVSPVPPVNVPPLSSKLPDWVEPERFTTRLVGVTCTLSAVMLLVPVPETGIVKAVEAAVPVVLIIWIVPFVLKVVGLNVSVPLNSRVPLLVMVPPVIFLPLTFSAAPELIVMLPVPKEKLAAVMSRVGLLLPAEGEGMIISSPEAGATDGRVVGGLVVVSSVVQFKSESQESV